MKNVNLGALEFEVFAILVMMAIDVVVGTVDHMWYTKDSKSGDARRSLMGKVGVAFTLIGGLIILHVNDWGEFGDSLNGVIRMCRNVLDGVVILILYYELVSILAHLTAITGIDFSKVPGVESEYNSKQLKAHKQKVSIYEMKGNNNGSK